MTAYHGVRLPEPGDKAAHWTPGRKELVLQMLDRGEITLATLHVDYDLSAEEVAGWRSRVAKHGHRGLRVLQTQRLR